MINMPPEFYEYTYFAVVGAVAFGILAMFLLILIDAEKQTKDN